MSIKISVIIPIYKVEPYLRQCVDSVLQQSYRNLEVILVDDGSPDNCPQICDNYQEKDKRVIVVHQLNGGLSAARNTGITMVTGEYVIFLDGDDFWDDKDAICRLVKRMEKTRPDVLNFSYKKYYESTGKKILQFYNIEARPVDITDKKEQLDYMMRESLYIASACNKLIRSDIVMQYMSFEKGCLSEDVEWCARLLCYAQSFDFICENFYCYRQRAESITHTIQGKACVDLKNNILGCIQTAEGAEEDLKKYIYQYTAYQLATFAAVQAIAEECPSECIEGLSTYGWILSYHGRNKKVTCLYYANKLLGFQNMCRVVRWTKKIWM